MKVTEKYISKACSTFFLWNCEKVFPPQLCELKPNKFILVLQMNYGFLVVSIGCILFLIDSLALY
jgi:hypothetical protein